MIPKHEKTTEYPRHAPEKGKLARKAKRARKKIRKEERRVAVAKGKDPWGWKAKKDAWKKHKKARKKAAKKGVAPTKFDPSKKDTSFAPDSPRLKDPRHPGWK